MMAAASAEPPPGAEQNPPAIAQVTPEDSARWIQKALDDFRRAPGLSLTLGGAYTLVALALVLGLDGLRQASLILPLASGFLLIGPLTAVLFTQISRTLETGGRPRLPDLVRPIQARAGPLVLFGLLLTGLMLSWLMTALILFALFYGTQPPPLEGFVVHLLTTPQALPFLATGTLVGGLFAAVAFAISVVSLPLILDRPEIGVGTAVATSLRAVRANAACMSGWAATLALITVSGMLFAFVGLAVTLPLAGFASWHAYRALVPIDADTDTAF